jgi:hypothetical protein
VRSILSATVAASLAVAGVARAADLSGSWQIKSGVANPLCRLVQTGDFLRGTCEGPAAKGVGFGVVEGSTVRFTWQWVGKENGVDGAFDFLGTIGADGNISGELIGMVDTARGPFTATKQPEVK